MVSSHCGVPRNNTFESSSGLMIASNSLTCSPSLSRIPWVALLLTTSISSATMISAREPVSCDVIPKDLTEGAWEAGAGPTSKEIFENRCLSFGRR